jgi:hypothetical protein
MTPLISEIAITGKYFEKRRNKVRNKPIVPTKIPTSTIVGV